MKSALMTKASKISCIAMLQNVPSFFVTFSDEIYLNFFSLEDGCLLKNLKPSSGIVILNKMKYMHKFFKIVVPNVSLNFEPAILTGV